ncbi:hypothetical protein SIAM614_00060 [Stappia aggregata IAM 12614]|uniref:Uncharacterized protein n=1 Tax=Roseibium aggregatum (strain ATCC 25650 / DSM 13394 / JCM 20685 / NBRC 16684 / NCIMB 2208 / IAM 12614 / B1) TaxID=384765 RepID=A0P494_ROSAI|nr:hypothetical protein SIAM614_00060 [Stappia aggregata IAM 12614] [Roseibium aggregatum IAM 12614]
MLGRETAGDEPAAVFTDAERNLLERATPDSKCQAQHDLDFYVRAVARIGGLTALPTRRPRRPSYGGAFPAS